MYILQDRGTDLTDKNSYFCTKKRKIHAKNRKEITKHACKVTSFSILQKSNLENASGLQHVNKYEER